MLAVAVVTIFFWLALRRPGLVPSRLQACGELIHDFVLDTLKQNTMGEGERYFPFIFSLFCFIIVLNLLGLIPHGFAVTGQISVTFALAIIVFIVLNVIGFARHGLHFFHLFLPPGIPLVLAPAMVVIELFVYLVRPATLAIRLTANMIAGHIFLYIATAFIVLSGIFIGVLPIPMVILFTGFEVFVAVLQAYIFTILTCVYLSYSIHLH
jgi:F-type H+-transporting ATPase subunit a